MGYDLHITRRVDWCDEGDDISMEEFVCCVQADTEFTYPGVNGGDSADWKSPRSNYESWLCWHRGQIYTKNPEPEFIDKMVVLSKRLRAKVQGDDGEVYLCATKLQKEEIPMAASAPAPASPLPLFAFLRWPLWKLLLFGFLLGCVLLGIKLLFFA